MKEKIEIAIRSDQMFLVLDKLQQDNKDIEFSYLVEPMGGQHLKHFMIYLILKREGGIHIQIAKQIVVMASNGQMMAGDIPLLWFEFMSKIAEQAITNDLVGGNKLVK